MSLASLADVVPLEQVRPVSHWFLRELQELIGERDGIEAEMRRLGSPGNRLSAYHEATDDLRTVVLRWERAIAPAEAA